MPPHTPPRANMAPGAFPASEVPYISPEGLATLEATQRYWALRGQFYTLMAILTSELPKAKRTCYRCKKDFTNTQPVVTGGPPVDGECANYGETPIVIPCGHVIGHRCAEFMMEHANQDGFFECWVCSTNFMCPPGTQGRRRGNQVIAKSSRNDAILGAYTSMTELDQSQTPSGPSCASGPDVEYLTSMSAADRAEIERVRSQPRRDPSPHTFTQTRDLDMPRGPYQRPPSPPPQYAGPRFQQPAEAEQPRGRPLRRTVGVARRARRLELQQQQAQDARNGRITSNGGAMIQNAGQPHQQQQQQQQQPRFHPEPGQYTQEEIDAAMTLLDMRNGTRNGGIR